ncbi:MAG TPA: AAA-like domain-containing protein, partial [Roseiflexaceae bacterium]
ADNLHRAVAGDSADAAGPRLDAPAAQQQPAASAPPRPLPWADPEPPEGVTEPQSAFYVERSADAEALRAIREQGVTVTIKGARQVGKTSLLSRVAAEARRHGKRALVLDFQLFERRLLGDTDRLFRYFCEAVTIGLGVESRVDAFWGNMGNSYHCTRYLERYLLPQLDAPLVLAIDKVDRLPHAATRSDFFGMLRTWCQNRATTPVWKRLDLVLVTSTEPHRLVDNPYQSPFNIGLTVALDDFTPAQVVDLNQRHGLPFAPAQLEALTALLGGHPYLIRRALYLATAGRLAPEELIARAHDDGGPFGDHLRYQLFKLGGQPKLIVELRRILSRGAHTDEQAFYELHSAGLVRREGERSAPRCQLYGAYLRERLA